MRFTDVSVEAAIALSVRPAVPPTHIQRGTRIAPDTEQVGKNETQPRSRARKQAITGGRGKKLRNRLTTGPGQGPLVNSLSKSQLVLSQ